MIRQSDDGTKIIFECRLIADPTPTIEWIFKEKSVKEDSRHHYFLKSDKHTHLASLEILKVCAEDAGEYKLVAKNTRGQSFATLNLNYDAGKAKVPSGKAPRFPRKPVIKQIGANLLLECVLEAQPLGTITWFHGSKVVQEGSKRKISRKELSKDTYLLSLQIDDPEAVDGGNYRCNAVNDLGESNANIALNFQEEEEEEVTEEEEEESTSINGKQSVNPIHNSCHSYDSHHPEKAKREEELRKRQELTKKQQETVDKKKLESKAEKKSEAASDEKKVGAKVEEKKVAVKVEAEATKKVSEKTTEATAVSKQQLAQATGKSATASSEATAVTNKTAAASKTTAAAVKTEETKVEASKTVEQVKKTAEKKEVKQTATTTAAKQEEASAKVTETTKLTAKTATSEKVTEQKAEVKKSSVEVKSGTTTEQKAEVKKSSVQQQASLKREESRGSIDEPVPPASLDKKASLVPQIQVEKDKSPAPAGDEKRGSVGKVPLLNEPDSRRGSFEPPGSGSRRGSFLLDGAKEGAELLGAQLKKAPSRRGSEVRRGSTAEDDPAEKPSIPLTPCPGPGPKIVDFQANQSATEGKTAVIVFSITGDPIPTFQFFKDDTEIFEGGRYKVVTDGSAKNVVNFCIRKSKVNDEGKYKFVVKNEHGQDAAEIALFVGGEEGMDFRAMLKKGKKAVKKKEDAPDFGSLKSTESERKASIKEVKVSHSPFFIPLCFLSHVVPSFAFS